MLRTAIKTMLARKLRLLTTSLAVLLGVAFTAGTLVLTDTIGKTFDQLFADVYVSTDAVVRGKTAVESSQFGDQRPRVESGALDELRKVDGVAEAQGYVEGYAQLVGKDDKVIGNPGQGPPTFGSSWIDSGVLNPFNLAEGRPPAADNEVVLDKGAADQANVGVGDRVKVLTQREPVEVDVVGIAKFGDADSPGGATFAMFTVSRAQALVGEEGKFDQMLFAAKDGVSQAELRDRLAAEVPDGAEALTGAEITEETQSAIKEQLSFFNIFLLIFAGIAVFVGAFIIYNTFSIIVAQRSREMALLRAIGASRRQVLGAVLFESLVVGLIAGIAGLVAGIGVAAGLKALLAGFGIDIPAGGIVVTGQTVVVSLLIGTVVSLVSAVFPARKAAKVPPIAAMRDFALDTSHRSRARSAVGIVVTGIGAAALANGLFRGGDRAAYSVGFGAAIVFVGVTILGPVFAGPLSRVIGAPLPRLRGVSGNLARENAMRNPKRTAATAAALMIGVGIVSWITIVASSVKESVNQSVDKTVSSDFIVATRNFGFGGLSPVFAQQLRTLPEIGAVSSFRIAPVELDSKQDFLLATNPDSIDQLFDIGVIEGSLADLQKGTIAVHDEKAKDKGWKIGDAVSVKFVSTGEQQLRVAAIYTNNDALQGSTTFVGVDTLEANVANTFDSYVFVALKDGVSAEAGRAALTKAVQPYPTAEVQDQTQYKASVSNEIDTFLNLVFVLLALAVIIALMGIANTLALSVFERTRELGLLRAVGMTRAQLRSTVRYESVIIALIGTLLGLVIGVFFGWAVVEALADEGFNTLTIPVGQLAVITVIAALAGVIAAILPARRAAKLDVLKAIATA